MPSRTVKINNTYVKINIDTGASINIIYENTFAYIKKHTNLIEWFAYGCLWFKTAFTSDGKIWSNTQNKKSG